jgi:hypothetical protein
MGKDAERVIVGTLYKFINVSPPWFDASKAEPIINEQGEKIHLVARHQKSNLKEIPFAFFPGIHRFFFSNQNVSARMVRAALEELCSGEEFEKEFGEISISVETSKEGISRILSLPMLNRLDIRITKPNPAGLNKYTTAVLRQMDEQGAERLEHNLASRSTMQPNDDTQTYMQAARSLGKVVAHGKDESGQPVTVSTEEYPVSHRRAYNSNVESGTEALVNCAREMATTLTTEE